MLLYANADEQNDDAFNARPSDSLELCFMFACFYCDSTRWVFVRIFCYFCRIVLGRCKIDSKEKLKVMQLHN